MYWPTKVATYNSRNGNPGQCGPYDVPLLANHRAIASTTAALFARPCRCASNWHAYFCTQLPHYRPLLVVPEKNQQEKNELPIVCICRHFKLESCQQFMTQCFSISTFEKQDKCTCCFNQPFPFCNQLQCHNNEPVFGVHVNTTCICHTPNLYPDGICMHHSAPFSNQGKMTSFNQSYKEMQHHYIKFSLRSSSMQQNESSTMKLYGLQITPAVAIAIVLGLLTVVVLLTMALLVVSTCRTNREHRNRSSKHELAQSVLLEQRADEEKYLPMLPIRYAINNVRLSLQLSDRSYHHADGKLQ